MQDARRVFVYLGFTTAVIRRRKELSEIHTFFIFDDYAVLSSFFLHRTCVIVAAFCAIYYEPLEKSVVIHSNLNLLLSPLTKGPFAKCGGI